MNHSLVSFLFVINTFITNTATYHVQGLTLQYYSDNGSVVVECEFAERSTAEGCHVIFRESSKGTVKFVNMNKSSVEESTVYQYLTLPVSGNYTVTVHDMVDGTIITNPSVVYPHVLEYILLLTSPTETVITSRRLLLYTLSYNTLPGLGITSSDSTIFLINAITSTSGVVNSVERNGKLNNNLLGYAEIIKGPGSIYLISGMLIAMVTLFITTIVIAFVCIIIQRKRKRPLITLNEGM